MKKHLLDTKQSTVQIYEVYKANKNCQAKIVPPNFSSYSGLKSDWFFWQGWRVNDKDYEHQTKNTKIYMHTRVKKLGTANWRTKRCLASPTEINILDSLVLRSKSKKTLKLPNSEQNSTGSKKQKLLLFPV